MTLESCWAALKMTLPSASLITIWSNMSNVMSWRMPTTTDSQSTASRLATLPGKMREPSRLTP